jgi:hypothetical protein
MAEAERNPGAGVPGHAAQARLHPGYNLRHARFAKALQLLSVRWIGATLRNGRSSNALMIRLTAV